MLRQYLRRRTDHTSIRLRQPVSWHYGVPIANVARPSSSIGASKPEDTVPAPTRRQLWSLAIGNAVPFIGFGFADNLIMIVATPAS